MDAAPLMFAIMQLSLFTDAAITIEGDGHFTATVGENLTLPWIYDFENDASVVEWSFTDEGSSLTPTKIMTRFIPLDAAALNDFNIMHNNNGNVTLTFVTLNNTGTYTCSVTYSLGSGRPLVVGTATASISVHKQDPKVTSTSSTTTKQANTSNRGTGTSKRECDDLVCCIVICVIFICGSIGLVIVVTVLRINDHLPERVMPLRIGAVALILCSVICMILVGVLYDADEAEEKCKCKCPGGVALPMVTVASYLIPGIELLVFTFFSGQQQHGGDPENRRPSNRNKPKESPRPLPKPKDSMKPDGLSSSQLPKRKKKHKKRIAESDSAVSRGDVELTESHNLTKRPMPSIPAIHDNKNRGLSANFDDDHPMIGVDIPGKSAKALEPLNEDQVNKEKKKKKKKKRVDVENDE